MSNIVPLRVNYKFPSPKSFSAKGPYSGRPGYELAPVEDASGWYHVGHNEKPAYEERYLFTDIFRPARTHPYTEESNWVYLARAFTAPEQWCFINERGRPMSPDRYLDARPFNYGHAAVLDGSGGWYHLDWRLEPIYRERFDDIGTWEMELDPNNVPYLYCDAVTGNRFYRIILRGEQVKIVSCIAW